MGVRTYKAKIRELLMKRDIDGLLAWAESRRSSQRVLFSLALEVDDLIAWRAVEAIGQVMARQAADDLERVRDTIRRLFWLMNDESGGLGWRSPVHGPVHPALVRLCEASGLGWLDGFDELLVRCGLESNGAPEFNEDGTVRYGLHGKIANIPAHKVELAIDGESGEIAVTGVVDESRLFFNKLRMTSVYTTRAGQPAFTVTDTIRNISAEPAELELLYMLLQSPIDTKPLKVKITPEKNQWMHQQSIKWWWRSASNQWSKHFSFFHQTGQLIPKFIAGFR